jgi:hypothetical protein
LRGVGQNAAEKFRVVVDHHDDDDDKNMISFDTLLPHTQDLIKLIAYWCSLDYYVQAQMQTQKSIRRGSKRSPTSDEVKVERRLRPQSASVHASLFVGIHQLIFLGIIVWMRANPCPHCVELALSHSSRESRFSMNFLSQIIAFDFRAQVSVQNQLDLTIAGALRPRTVADVAILQVGWLQCE